MFTSASASSNLGGLIPHITIIINPLLSYCTASFIPPLFLLFSVRCSASSASLSLLQTRGHFISAEPDGLYSTCTRVLVLVLTSRLCHHHHHLSFPRSTDLVFLFLFFLLIFFWVWLFVVSGPAQRGLQSNALVPVRYRYNRILGHRTVSYEDSFGAKIRTDFLP
ncbi:hypothetical protein B9Z19DRAFT_1089752 [Tuber borchii]|uniref:Uncharacterized protein n=1 Tax=Tuber borchii TaxID=42251 RepID=A0A2T6ZJP5_TUBBO|nr:hypothetical protein B9Z19DRAFT_1089752 [Tuber borchii]